ncbi:MAG: PKD domain-containing protein [Cyclobacteriaceae bacterium]|nr:PKD domain-containing protein [Cyclobacteriaceae bacterium]
MKKSMYKLLSSTGIITLVLMLVVVTSCKKEEEVIPDINVAFSFSPTNPEAGELVTFTNASNGGTKVEWDFGDDAGTSTANDPTYTYSTAGTYTISLKVDGFEQLTATKDIVVGDPVPVIAYTPEAVEAGAEITFSATVYNPDSETITYDWSFGANAIVDDTTAASPKVTFTKAETVTVTLTATIGALESVGSTDITVVGQLAKTLFFSVVDMAGGSGSIYTKKIFTGFDEDHTDFNVPTNSHPLTLRVRNDRVYVFDAGDGITWTTDPAAIDGSIYSASLSDASDYITHISMADGDGDYTRDPFFGDVTDSKIYWGDRRNGIYAIDATSADVTYTFDGVGGYFAGNSDLGYYSAHRTDGGPTYGWGALNGTFLVRDNGGTDEFWWAKNSNHKGLWRFEASDIGVTGTVPALGGVLTAEAVRAFDLDETNQKIYFSINTVAGMGFYRSDFDGSNIELVDGSAWDSEGGDAERTGITGIAVDAEGGYVYWGYRATSTPDPDNAMEATSGIKRWKLDGTEDVEFYIEDVWVYGLAIDHAKK